MSGWGDLGLCGISSSVRPAEYRNPLQVLVSVVSFVLIMDTVNATIERLRAQCLSRGALGIQGLAR